MNYSKFISRTLITLSFFIGMNSVFSSDLDDQDDLPVVPNNTHKIIGIIPHTPGDILICEKILDPNIVTIVDASLLTRQETDGLRHYTSLTGEIIDVDHESS
ncbi:MAG: hypothetical protein WCP46_05630 [Alphaproteobacteria bacterium]